MGDNDPGPRYERLTPAEAAHFLEHGWLLIPNSLDPKYIDTWTRDMWIRTGLDPNDKSTWKNEYLHLSHHRQIRHEDLCPGAWGKILDICGGEEMLAEERERWVGDSFIINFGSDKRKVDDPPDDPKKKGGWHIDNDWFRMFLDSSECALTVIHCFSDMPEGGGGTMVCEDAIQGIVKTLYDHPEGFDPIVESAHICDHVPECHTFVPAIAKKGDTILTHGFLPHTASYNHLHFPRIISNPHVTLRAPYNLNRSDGKYTLLEQVILKRLGRNSLPEWHPTRERKHWYARNIVFKQNRVPEELERLKAHAKKNGTKEEDIDSIYLKGDKAMADFNRVNGLDLPVNEDLGFETKQHLIG